MKAVPDHLVVLAMQFADLVEDTRSAATIPEMPGVPQGRKTERRGGRQLPDRRTHLPTSTLRGADRGESIYKKRRPKAYFTRKLYTETTGVAWRNSVFGMKSTRLPQTRGLHIADSSLLHRTPDAAAAPRPRPAGAGCLVGGCVGAAAGGRVPPILNAQRVSPCCDRLNELPPAIIATYCWPFTS